ncbi:alanine--glyoxylate aminotransferase family protein [Brevibacillus nitrificans]|uniref:Alanine--glyoxylate aminotransferase family protein n=1 Tax=Brevibacillus nitrificans TaxID=651560 RepID=A0A3M8DT02_9BACL|nr:aminotransferase class V-fold PLP-dependent enzyme [Brevibacillus nitrificans]RNB90107.1 alanine--glyoxylate aminotransferase family protein [Brevibacillus nitrificans]
MLNFSVGPVMMEQETLRIGSEQIPYFRTEQFSETMIENEVLLKKLTHATEASRVIFLTGSGTAAMEAAVINIFNENDKLLVVNGGSFGARFKEICDVHGLSAEELHLNFGETLKSEHLEKYDRKGFTGFLLNVHETSTGILYDMNLVKEFCERNQLILVADAISSFLADPYDMSEYGVNATILSSQKALALPPGMSFVLLDEKAQERVLQNKVKSLYFNFKNYLADGLRGQTPYTPAVGVLLQLRERLLAIEHVGTDKTIEKVAYIAQDFRTRMKQLPLELAPGSSFSNAITPLRPTGEITADRICNYLRDDYQIYVCPNGGSLSKVLFRVGHIGAITIDDNRKLIEAFLDMQKKGLL